MADQPRLPIAEPHRRLYVISGVMKNHSHFEVMPGILLALNEDEARGAHVRWMMDQRPGYTVDSVAVYPLPDELALQAVREIKRAQHLDWVWAHVDGTPVDPTAQTEPLTTGQQIVARHEEDMIAEPCELAEAIDKAIWEATQNG